MLWENDTSWLHAIRLEKISRLTTLPIRLFQHVEQKSHLAEHAAIEGTAARGMM